MNKKTTKVAKKKIMLTYKLDDECPNHDKHLCHIVSMHNMRMAGCLAKDAKYLCAVCGRAAKNRVNLCAPAEI